MGADRLWTNTANILFGKQTYQWHGGRYKRGHTWGRWSVPQHITWYVGRGWHWMTTTPELTIFVLRFCSYKDYLTFNFIFQTSPRVLSFQMAIEVLSGMHKKWIESEQSLGNTQIVCSVRLSTCAVKKCSVCDYSDQISALKLNDTYSGVSQ